MIESKESYESFYKEVDGHDLILHVVPSEMDFHATATHPVALFVYDTQTNKSYTISFTHPDIDFKVATTDPAHRFRKQNNRLWTMDKKSFIQTLPMSDLHDINLLRFLKNNSTFIPPSETPAHAFIKRTSTSSVGLGRVIPLLKHKEMFDMMVSDCLETVKTAQIDEAYKTVNGIIIETLAELESNGIHVDKTCFEKHFGARVYKSNQLWKDVVYSQYNIYTSTGRPSNRFDGVNYAALKKDDGCRKCFVTRYSPDWHDNGNGRVIDKVNGKMVLIDYSAFHPRIICRLVGFDLPLDTDIYQYLGELYFGRTNLTPVDIDEAKKLTFRQLYGGVEKQYEHIKYFGRLKGFVEEHWKSFCKNGWVETPFFQRKITSNHIQDANPSKLFNYILQAAETEIAVPVIAELNRYLKNKLTKAVLYTYDSILFDFAKNDGAQTLKDIVEIMKYNNRFPVKVYAGDSYDDLNQISVS